MKHTPVVILDLETTGLSARKNKITEIAAVRTINGKVINKFESLVNPETHIPSFITKLTGIDDEMVEDAPTINQVLPKFLSFMSSDIIVGHNVTFDYNFLQHNMWKLNQENITNDKICTAKLARRVLNLPSVRLEALREYFKIEKEGSHRAMNDVLATKLVFNNIIKKLEEKNIKKVNEILSFQHFPSYKVIKILEGDGYASR